MIPLLALALTAPPELDLTRAVVVAPSGLTGPAAEAVRMLTEEVAARSFARWERAETMPGAGVVIVVGPAASAGKLLQAGGLPSPNDLGTGGPEGYQVGTSGRVVWVAGNDARGVLFGVGRLLRELRIGRDKVTLPAGFYEKSAPTTPLRGHQLGYRPKTNSYDAWTVAMWEQYLRDLIVFGCNTVELIPPRSDDDADSPHFPLPPLRMLAEVSRLADRYGLDVWLWYPAMDKDYPDPKTVAFALKEWGEVFAAVPRIDAVFVPGGDPGHTPPKVLFDLLEKQTANLHRHHPRATMWVSPQSFTASWMDDFLALMKQPPAWLSGVVYGPQTRMSLPRLKAALPAGVPVRDYPDITHSRQCQYPAPDWDVAYAVTQGREGSNPRPTETAHLFRYGRKHTVGFITYSEGCHDDVNKMVWSALGWDDTADVKEVLRQYGRYFVAPELADRFADGLLGLERNWKGPMLANAGIEETLKLFQAMEREASPRVKLSWRFQQALYRAYYDAYVRARLQHETGWMDAAYHKLRQATPGQAAHWLAEADADLARGQSLPRPDLRARLSELAEALFQSIRAQLSVAKYQAQPGRGNSLDTADTLLTDAAWLRAELARLKGLPTDPDRHAGLQKLLDRTDPGPGGFYDDFGDPERQPHLDRGPGWDRDPGFDESPQCAFSLKANIPRAWWHYAETHYETPLRAKYADLDPAATYRVRVVYGQQEGRPVRLTAGDGLVVHDWLHKAFEPVEFAVPKGATADGKLTLTWTPKPGAGGPGRGCQVCEVFLLKTPAPQGAPPLPAPSPPLRGRGGMPPRIPGATMLTADQLDALRRYPSPTVANALERLGVPHNHTDARIRCLFPEFGVMLGYAATATVRSVKPADRAKFPSRRPYWDHIGRHPAPRVLVAQDLDQPPGGAYWGEVNGTIHQTLGCVGVLTDGTVRDLEEVRRFGFHFFAAGVEVSHGFAHLEGYDEPVTVFGMTVNPGDLIHADRHGAVVVPADVAGEVADACRAVDDYERPMLELCRGPNFSTAALARLLERETV